MTLSSTTNRVAYAGNGSTVEFAVPFLFADNGHIVATLRGADGTEVAWSEITDYNLSGAGEPAGGTLTAAVAPADQETLVIRRVVPLTQETDYVENDPFPAETHEQALDLAAMRDQQLQEQLDRTLRFPITDTSPLPELPSFNSRASKLLGFDSSGDPTLVAGNDASADTVTVEGGATSRSFSEILGQTITPRDFGAVGDGTADDTAAVLACLKDGRPVFLEAGKIYKITDALDLRGYSGRMIFGAGAAAGPSGGFEHSQPSIIRQATNNKQILRLSGSGHSLSGFYLDYASQQSTASTAALAIELNNVSHSAFRNLRIFRANTSIGIPQSAYGATAYNSLFDTAFDGIDSNEASECHIDLRNYNGGGTNTTLRNIYINGGGSLDFVTAGQSANYAMRFAIWSGLEIGALSIDGLIVNTSGIVFNNTSYVMQTARFEACTLKPNSGVWIDHAGGYCNGWVGLLDFENDRWSPTAATSMYCIQTQSTVIKLTIEKIRVVNTCNFGSSGTRRACINSGTGISGTGYVNSISIDDVEDQGSKLSDLAWTDSNGLTGPYNIGRWRGSQVNQLLRSAQSATTARFIGGTAPPTGGTWNVGDTVVNLTPGDIGRAWGWQCTTAGSPGIWIPIAFSGAEGGGATTWGDVGATLTPGISRRTNVWLTTLTADRTVAIANAGNWSGCTFRISRPASGAFNLNVNNPAGSTLKALAAGTWCDVAYDSFNWRLTAYGSF